MLNKSFLVKCIRTVFISIFLLLVFVPPKAEAVRFIVAGDSRGGPGTGYPFLNTTILGEIAQATLAENADFILLPGDLVWGYPTLTYPLIDQLAAWRTTMQPVYDAGIGVFPCRGNHDAANDSPARTAWNTVFSGEYALPDNGPAGEENITYSFSAGDVFVVALDQYPDNLETHTVNQAWLDAQFAANALPHVFVFGHEPAFFAGDRVCLDLAPDGRNTLWNSIAAEGGRTYFCAHDHKYAHARIDNGDSSPDNDLHQFIVATAGTSFYNAPVYSGDNAPFTPVDVFHEMQFGYVLVEVENKTVTMTWKHRTAPGVYAAAGDVFTYTLRPSLVRLSSFEAAPKFSKVLLRWTTESESDNAGFNVYRAESKNGQYIKINDALIPARGSHLEGATYAFADTAVNNRQTYYYKLEDIDLKGTSTMNGPVRTVPRLTFGLL